MYLLYLRCCFYWLWKQIHSDGLYIFYLQKWRRIASDESLWRDLVSCRVGLDRTQLPDCHSWYEEYRRLCMNIPMIQSEVLKEHDDEVYHVLFSPSGKYFTTTGKDGYVVVSISVKGEHSVTTN